MCKNGDIMNVKEEFWQEESVLVDLLFLSNLSIPEIAKRLGWTAYQTRKKIHTMGLAWVTRKDRKLSRGHASLVSVMQKLLPGVEIITEHHIGERLMLDIYCPKYNLALEFHGRQHFTYSSLFHKDHNDFIAGQQRDDRKIELCKQAGITLIVFRYNEDLTEEIVFERVYDAIKGTDHSHAIMNAKRKLSPIACKGNPIYEESKIRRRQWEKEMRRKIKDERARKEIL